jgi:hypothetical protein
MGNKPPLLDLRLLCLQPFDDTHYLFHEKSAESILGFTTLTIDVPIYFWAKKTYYFTERA